MYLVIFILLSITAILLGDKKPTMVILISLILIISAFVGFRGDDVDNDYQSYVNAIEQQSYISELSFQFISDFFYSVFHSTLLTFLFYALFGVGLKLIAFKRYSNYFWLTLVLYFSTFFVLQEMNAMRAGVASGFMLLSFKPWSEEKRGKALLFLLLAFLFHYSFIIVIPLLLFVSNKEDKVLYYLFLIPIGYLIYLTIDISAFIPFQITYLADKFNDYISDESTNVLSTVFIVKIIFILFLYIFRSELAEKNKYFYLFLKLYCFGIFMVVIFANLPAASMRFMDVFIIVELFLIPMFCNLTTFERIPAIAIVIYAYFYFYLYVDVAEYIRPYYTIFNPI